MRVGSTARGRTKPGAVRPRSSPAAAPRNGRRGTRTARVVVVTRWPLPSRLSVTGAGGVLVGAVRLGGVAEPVDVRGAAVAVDGEDDRQADADLGGGDGDGEQGEGLAGVQGPAVAEPDVEGDEVEVDGVEHQLDGHQDQDRVAAGEDAVEAGAEEEGGEHGGIGEVHQRAPSCSAGAVAGAVLPGPGAGAPVAARASGCGLATPPSPCGTGRSRRRGRRAAGRRAPRRGGPSAGRGSRR